jgi:glucan phosphoethanolaminetransferase (alkaline phosphatase superfamily)
MNRKIILFNIIYYGVIISLIALGREDSSSSLGYGYFILFFIVVAAIILIFLLTKKVIRPKSLFEKIGVFTATPVLIFIGLLIFLFFKENETSIAYFTENNYRYKEIKFDNNKFSGGKRIEYYRSKDTIRTEGDFENIIWIKDSTWIYLSEQGDTIKKIKYKNGIKQK